MEHTYDDLFIDFDDTLCDTHAGAQKALCGLFEEYGLGRWFPDPQVFYDAYWQTNIDLWQQYGRGEISRDYLIVERFRRPLALSGEWRVENLEFATAPETRAVANSKLSILNSQFRAMNDRFLDLCVENTGVLDGAHELVDYLRRRGYRLHLCSNGFHEVQFRKLRNCGLDGCFDSVILSEDAGVNKPRRGFFDYAFRLSQANPATTVMIGDGWDSDMRGAIDYGLDTIFFNRFPDYPPPEPVTYEVHRLADIQEIL